MSSENDKASPANSSEVTVTLATQTSPSYEQTLFGRQSPTIAGIEEFRGIPYGIIPARWQHSIARTSLPSNNFDASKHGLRCPQLDEPNDTFFYQSHLDFPDLGQSEYDCLNLFIIRPSPKALSEIGIDFHMEKIPVYFYIHGGGFGFGSGTDPIWDPSRMVARSVELRKPMIVVNINYRVNLFGFAASTEIVEAQSGSVVRGCNFGLGDQRTALEWVSRNISSFGGDAEKITIGGQSAGAASVHAHALEAKFGSNPPLFQKAIMQSGAIGSLHPKPMKQADQDWEKLCQHFDIPAGSDKSRVELMSAVPESEIVQALHTLNLLFFNLVEDGKTIEAGSAGRWNVNFGQTAATLHLEQASKKGLPLVVLAGDVDLEGSGFHSPASKISDYGWVKAAFQESYTSDVIAQRVLLSYKITPNLPEAKIRRAVLQFLTDVMFGYPVHMARVGLSNKEASGRETSSAAYRVSFGNPFHGNNYQVPHHCVDLIYVYDCFHDALVKADKDEMSAQGTRISNLALACRMQSDWIHFITGDGSERGENEAMVYANDRHARLENVNESSDWQERTMRFGVLDSHWQGSLTAMKTVRGIGS